MVQRKLSKAQGYVVQGLATQLNQLQAQANEIQAALNEQAELARLKYKLPEGAAQFTQGPDGWTLVVTPQSEPDDGAGVQAIDAPKPGPSETKAAKEPAKVE